MFQIFGKTDTDLEKRVAALEQQIIVLEAQVKKLSAAAAKDKASDPKEKHIQSIMGKTGWTREETIEKVEAARRKVGINYTGYDKYDFHTVAADQQATEYKKIVEAAPAKGKKARKARKNETLLLTVLENTPWSYDEAKSIMDKCQELTGAEYKDYVAYRFWELDEETQKTYFTKGHANALRKKYNTSKENIRFFMNKNEFDEKFSAFLGRPWAHTTKMTLDEFKTSFAAEPKIIYKPLSDSCGHGVTVFDLNEEVMEAVYNRLKELPEGVVEGYVKQHPEMSKYSRKSVNTIRLVTVRAFGEVNPLYAAFRMGGGDAVVDNFHAGGVLALINLETGKLETNAIDLAGTFYENHPVTGEKILGFQIPYWNEIIEMIKKAGKVVDGIGYVGWDVAVTETGPILIEGNTAPAPNVLQTPYAKEHKGMRHVIEKYL